MAAEVGKIQFKVGLKNQENVKKELTTLKNDVVGGLGASFGKLGGLIVAAFSVSAIISFAKECRNAYDTSVEYQTKLETIMRQRMNATDEEINKIRELNSLLQTQGVIEDDIAAAGAQQLSTFLTTSSSLETLIPAMENLIAQQKGFNATTGDAVNVGNLMGKVMQGQTSALTRVGITFNEAQEQVLKYGNEEERAAMLAEVITDNVGDMNKELGNTPQGKMLQIKNTWGDIQENIGNILTSGIYPFLDSLNTMLGYLNSATAKLAEFAQQWAGLSGITLPSVSSSLGDVEDSVVSVGEATNKTVFGFDNLNKLTSQSSSGGGSTTTNKNNQTNNIIPDKTTKEFDFKFNLNESELESIQNIIDNVSGTFENLGKIAGTLGDMFSMAFNIGILQPFENHSDDIRGIFDDILNLTDRLTISFENFTKRASDKIDEFAKGRFKDACEEMGNDMDKALKTFFEGYEKYVEPTIELVVQHFEEVFGEGGTMDQSLDKILENFAIVIENSGWLMQIIAYLGIGIGLLFGMIGDVFVSTIEFIGESISAGAEMLAGLSLILEGLFDGSFEKIKEGFALLIQSFIDQITSLFNYWNNLFGLNSLGAKFGLNVSQPSVGPTQKSTSSRQTSNTPNHSTTSRNSNQTIVLQLDKHVLGQVTGNVNSKNEWVLG